MYTAQQRTVDSISGTPGCPAPTTPFEGRGARRSVDGLLSKVESSMSQALRYFNVETSLRSMLQALCYVIAEINIRSMSQALCYFNAEVTNPQHVAGSL